MFRAGSKVLNGLNLSFNVFRAGSKVFDAGKNTLIDIRAGSKVFDACVLCVHCFSCGFQGF